MQSDLGWSGLEAPVTGRATQTDGPALACRGPACASGEQLSACSRVAQKVPSPTLQAPLSWSPGPNLDERNQGRSFLLQASMNAGVSKRIPQLVSFTSLLPPGSRVKTDPGSPWGGAGERGGRAWGVGHGLEPGTLQGQPASPDPLSQLHPPLEQTTGERAVLVPAPALA